MMMTWGGMVKRREQHPIETHLEAHRDMMVRQAKSHLMKCRRAMESMSISVDEAAEDLVQDTVIRALRAWDRYDGRPLGAWLTIILKRLCINYLSKEVHHQTYNTDPHTMSPSSVSTDEVWDRQVDSGFSDFEFDKDSLTVTGGMVEQSTISHKKEVLTQDILREAEKLPYHQELLVRWCLMGGISVREAARRLMLPEPTARQSLRMARVKLQGIMKDGTA